MEEKLLIHCANSITANNVVNILDSNNIAWRQHDETQDQNFGAYGPTPGIAIFVFEKDYAKAQELISTVLKDLNQESILCPKCGSENVEPIKRKREYSAFLTILSLILIIIPAAYYGWTKGDYTHTANQIALISFMLGSTVLIINTNFINNYKCKDCGKKFSHK